MKRVYLSILFTVFGSLILIGWVLDKVAENESDTAAPIEIELYQRIIRSAALQLDQMPLTQLDRGLIELQQQFQLEFALEPLVNLALPPELSSQLNLNGRLSLESSEGAFLIKKLDKHDRLLLQLSVPLDNQSSSNLDIALTLALYLGVGLSLAIWLLPLTSRLSLLTKTAAAFGTGKLDERIVPSKFSYIRKLEFSFNRMAGQIETLVADNKLLAESLSHDLRTPVACLRFGIEAALDSKDEVKTQQYLIRIEDELTRMESMLEAFLSYASMERKAQELKLADTDVVALLQSSVDEMQALATQSQINLNFTMTGSISKLKIDYHWFYRAIVNLISNALDHARTRVEIYISDTSNQLQIEIHDDGPGVPEDKRDAIFDPFVTVENSRNRQTTSYGLGLAIVNRVVHWHGGRVTITESKILGGACFTILLVLP